MLQVINMHCMVSTVHLLQTTITDIQTKMTDHHKENTKLREANIELNSKMKTLMEQYEVREQVCPSVLCLCDLRHQFRMWSFPVCTEGCWKLFLWLRQCVLERYSKYQSLLGRGFVALCGLTVDSTSKSCLNIKSWRVSWAMPDWSKSTCSWTRPRRSRNTSAKWSVRLVIVQSQQSRIFNLIGALHVTKSDFHENLC